MLLKKLSLLTLACFSIATPCVNASQGDFITVSKGNVIHKFGKVDQGGWIDNFLANQFVNWENDTFAVFEQVKNKDGIALDIGAWLGTTSIWLSNNFAYVVAVEPDSESIMHLKKNLDASSCKNVRVCEKAITHHGKPVIFGPRVSMFHGDKLNGSMSFVKEKSDSKIDYEVSSSTIADIYEEYIKSDVMLKNKEIAFIKCDIEGGEEMILEDVLKFALKHKCKAWISFHAAWWSHKKIEQFADLFKEFKADVPLNDVVAFIQKYPFESVLFYPKEK